MKIVIYGRESCKYCQRAKRLAEQCQQWLKNFEYEIDYNGTHGWYAEALSQHIGITVTTVPQIFANGKHLGGFSEFELYLKNKAAINQIEFK